MVGHGPASGDGSDLGSREEAARTMTDGAVVEKIWSERLPHTWFGGGVGTQRWW
jgi:hypothetical protein